MVFNPQPPEPQTSARVLALKAENYLILADAMLQPLGEAIAKAAIEGRNWIEALPDPNAYFLQISTAQTFTMTANALANLATAFKLNDIRPNGMPELKLPPMPPGSGPGSQKSWWN